MSKSVIANKPAVKTPAKAVAPKAVATPMPTLATLPTAPVVAPKTIALRGGMAVTNVKLTGTPFRVAAPHNQLWWKTLSEKLAAGPQPVAGLLASTAQPNGVPAHFLGYALRRGYLASV